MQGDNPDLEVMFGWIDRAGVTARTAQVSMSLSNRSQMTIRAGGAGIHSWPPEPPFELYEVLISEEPPKFWNKYSDVNGVTLYDKVPRLLICHHIIRSGGAFDLVFERFVRNRTGLMDVRLSVTENNVDSIRDAVEAMKGVQVVWSSFSLDG